MLRHGSRCASTLAFFSSMAPVSPVIAIVGATGTGKSKLAVQIAGRFNGEIINADAMQMYKGLPIITNKIPLSEQNGIPHHLLDVLELQEPPWTVRNYVQEAQKVVNEIRSRGRTPIVVGGTGYYVHSLLFRGSTLEGSTSQRDENADTDIVPDGAVSQINDLLSKPTAELYERLQQLDPVMASRRHPVDRRKIQRALEICLRTGQKASDLYEEQRTMAGSNADPWLGQKENGSTPLSLRYPTLILWLDAETSALKTRLDDRVLAMVKDGLLEEAALMSQTASQLASDGVPVDQTKGIWVSIGYKELSVPDRSHQENIEAIQAGTRQYAKRQHRYIRIRLANDIHFVDATDQFFWLDATDPLRWEADVSSLSDNLVKTFLQGQKLPPARSLSERADLVLNTVFNSLDEHTTPRLQFCEVCGKTMMTEKEWQGHLHSNTHKKRSAGQRKRAERARYERERLPCSAGPVAGEG